MYKHIFLDFDDTIYDTHGNADIALQELYQHFSLGNYFDSFETFSKIYWKRNVEVWAMYSRGEMAKSELIVERFLTPLRTVGIDDSNYALTLNKWFLERTSEKSNLVNGAREILDYLKSRYSIHILSNGFTEVQHKKIRNAGVEQYFDSVILSEDVGCNKPDPKIFSYALEKTGAAIEETIMIGDNFDTDILGAKRSNINQIYFNPNKITERDFEPTHEVFDLMEIKNIL